MLHFRLAALPTLLALALAEPSGAATLHVSIKLDASDRVSSNDAKSSRQTVVWLSAIPHTIDPKLVAPVPGHFRVEQRDKSFHPNFLVVPLGSTVDFPNRDPFFHNVFSQFNGKRFDLGLYEAGSTRSVHFDHEGVSYIFCNIHSEMAAVIISVGTPFYTVVSGAGTGELNNVPAGEYLLHVWRQGTEPSQLNSLTQHVRVSGESADAVSVQMPRAVAPGPHRNKFGEPYPSDSSSSYPK